MAEWETDKEWEGNKDRAEKAWKRHTRTQSHLQIRNFSIFSALQNQTFPSWIPILVENIVFCISLSSLQTEAYFLKFKPWNPSQGPKPWLDDSRV